MNLGIRFPPVARLFACVGSILAKADGFGKHAQALSSR